MKVNINDLDWQESTQENFTYSRKQLGASAGSQLIGTSLYKLLPGQKAFPFHFHHANEEAIFILDGQGTLRINKERISIQKDDYIALPRGPEYSHQVINTSNAPLIYLCISTMIEPDVMQYPDSNKVGVMTGTAPGESKNKHSFKAIFKLGSEVSYYESEK